MATQAEKQRLIDGGWQELENGCWLREGMNPKLGGHTTPYALKRQDKLDLLKKNGVYYFVMRDPFGYGYYIMENNGIVAKKTPFDHLTEEKAEQLTKQLNLKEADMPCLPPPGMVRNKFPKIIVWHEKHGDRYFIVPTRYDLEEVALKIVLERNEGEWYDFDVEKPEAPSLTVEDAKKFGMTGVLKATEQEWESYNRGLTEYETSVKLQEALDKIVKNNDSQLSLLFADKMKDGEYEGFELIDAEQI